MSRVEIKRAFVFGAVLLDELPTGRVIGGAPFNFAFYLHRFGVPTWLVSSVGRDTEGEQILETMSRFGMSQEWVGVAADQPTGLARVTLDEFGIPTFVLQEEAAYDHIAGRPVLSAGDLVYFGSGEQRKPVSRESLRAILRERGEALAFCDLNIRQGFQTESMLHDSFAAADILKVNEEELALVSKIFGVADVPRWLYEKYEVATLLVTRGSRGAGAWQHGHAIADVAAPQIDRVGDTVGAGDAFSARFVAGLARTGDIARSLAQAVAFASETCRYSGAIQESLDFTVETV